MKNLSEYSVQELRARVGERIRSLFSNDGGILVSVSEEVDREDYILGMDWDNGNKSRYVWIFWADKVVFEKEFEEDKIGL